MARRPEPIQKSVKEVLDDIRNGYREAAVMGPESGLKYLQRNFEKRNNVPYAVRTVAYDLMAECQAQLRLWEDCAASVVLALSHLGDAEEEFPHGFREMLEGLTCFERGIQANSELGQYHAALELCDRAVALDLGAHYIAKRDSMEWAR